jgi:hypothetical protein
MGISNICGELVNEDNPIYLVGGIPIPLKNMSSSVGIIIPTYSKYRGNIKNVPNHQPDGEFMKKNMERSMGKIDE